MTPPPTQTVIHALDAKGCGPRRSGEGWSARCPAHEDRNASLSVNTGEDGRALVCCHAGCESKEIVSALNLKTADLFAGKAATAAKASKTGSVYFTAGEAVAALSKRRGRPSAWWSYRDARGVEVGRALRWDLPGGEKEVRPVALNCDGWKFAGMAEPRPLYRLPEIIEADPDEIVYIVEGEKCADVVVACGLVATTTAQGAQSPHKSDFSALKGRSVVVLPDHDDAGEEYAERVVELATKAGASSVKIVRIIKRWPDLGKGGDIADALETEGGDIEAVRAALVELVEAEPCCKVDLSAIAETKPSGPRLVVTDWSDVTPRAVEWLWEGYIPMGGITMMAGAPGVSKTTIAMDLAARLTTGRAWPDGASSPGRGRVIVASAEDIIENTLHPRFLVAGGDPDYARSFDGYSNRGDEDDLELWTVDQIGMLEDLIEATPDCRLVIIDPITAFMPAKCDDHQNSAVRAALRPLHRMAERTGVTLLLVSHLRKGSEGSPLDRLIGSMAYGAAVRSVIGVTHDNEDETGQRGLLVPVKTNLAPMGVMGIPFDREPAEIPGIEGGSWPRLIWREPVQRTAEEAMAARRGRPPVSRQEAEAFLIEVFREHPEGVPSKELIERAGAEGISDDALKSARKSLGVKAVKLKNKWVSVLPGSTICPTQEGPA